jgi:hypothetical protein
LSISNSLPNRVGIIDFWGKNAENTPSNSFAKDLAIFLVTWENLPSAHKDTHVLDLASALSLEHEARWEGEKRNKKYIRFPNANVQ